jgi:hypothetical protein
MATLAASTRTALGFPDSAILRSIIEAGMYWTTLTNGGLWLIQI